MVRTAVRFAWLLWLMTSVHAYGQDCAAGGGSIPIPFAAIAYPITIPPAGGTTSCFVLAFNLTAPVTGTPMITIGAGARVEINLNGNVLNNLANPGSPVIFYPGGAAAEIVIRNGTLVGGSDTIAVGAAGAGATKVVIENVRIATSGMSGIHLTSTANFTIRRNVITGTGVSGPAPPAGAGILVDTVVAPTSIQGTIEDNLIDMTLTNGIVVSAAAGLRGTVILQKNQLNQIRTGGGGALPPPNLGAISLLNVEPCLVAQNTIRGVNGTGIYAQGAQGCKFENNALSDMGVNGIHIQGAGVPPNNANLSQDNLLIHNVVRGAFIDGIVIAGARNNIEANVIHNTIPPSAGWGLHLTTTSTNNRYGRNSAVGNAGGACVSPGTTDFCDDAPAGANISFGDNLMPGPGKL